MSVSNQVTIWCDECQNWEQYSDTAKGARKDLKKKGWIVNRPGGKDYCPNCVKVNK